MKLPSFERFEAFIVAGTPISIYEADKHGFLREEMAYLKAVVKKSRPYLGICGGAQLLAKLLGAEVRKNPVMEIGGYNVKLTPAGKKHKFFSGFPDTFPVFHWHGDTFNIQEVADCSRQEPTARTKLLVTAILWDCYFTQR